MNPMSLAVVVSALAMPPLAAAQPSAVRAPTAPVAAQRATVSLEVTSRAASVSGALPDAQRAPSVRARSNFPMTGVPTAVRRLADAVLGAGDNARQPFVVIDKRSARLFVIDAAGRLIGATPVLLGAARGDDSVPGIGDRPIAAIRPFERTTPAGRFIAAAGENARGEDIVWVDYDAAVSMHRVRVGDPRERRQQRLDSPTAADNRISYGCINLPAAFFDRVIGPLFRGGRHAVYILPEVKTVQQVFGWAGSRRAG